MASLTDKFTRTRNGARPTSTTVTSARAVAGTTLACGSLAGWPTASAVHFVTYKIDTSSKVVPGTQCDWKGIVSGTNITNLTLQDGTDAGNAIGDVVEMLPTAAWGEDLAEGLEVAHNRDGSLVSSAVRSALGIGDTSFAGWDALGAAPNSVTYNGNRSYDLVFNSTDLTSTVSPGMRLRTTRTAAAPTRSTLLNGTSQYYSDSSVSGMTFTDDFVVGAWVKLSSYSGYKTIAGRFNGTSGWRLGVTSAGQVELVGFNAGSSNLSLVTSYQSLPLNKWVHVAVQLDMSAFTASSTTSYIMFDGVDVPASVSRGGTNPTALVQAGDLQVGADNGANFFPGKIAQAFVSSAKITQANVRTLYSQGLTPALITSNNIISAYSFDNSITDLNTTNANNLTANGGAVATNADSPFGTQASGSISSTLDYGIVQAATFSTNTTLTVQVPEGCTIPTSGGVSSVVYSSNKSPYGFPGQRGKWTLETLTATQATASGLASTAFTNLNGRALTVPVGEWLISQHGVVYTGDANTNAVVYFSTSPSALAYPTGLSLYNSTYKYGTAVAASYLSGNINNVLLSQTTQTAVYSILQNASAGARSFVAVDNESGAWVKAENAYL